MSDQAKRRLERTFGDGHIYRANFGLATQVVPRLRHPRLQRVRHQRAGNLVGPAVPPWARTQRDPEGSCGRNSVAPTTPCRPLATTSTAIAARQPSRTWIPVHPTPVVLKPDVTRHDIRQVEERRSTTRINAFAQNPNTTTGAIATNTCLFWNFSESWRPTRRQKRQTIGNACE